MTVARDESLPPMIAEARLARAIAAAGKDVMGKLSKSMKQLINAVSEKFSGLVTGNQAVVATPYIPKEDMTALKNELQKIEKNTPRMSRQEHLSEVSDLCVFMMSHVSLTPYIF